MRPHALVLALALMLAACAADRTAILVEVTSPDLSAPDDVDELRFEAVTETGARVDSRHAIQDTWPHSLTIVPPESERMGSLTLTVTGLRDGELVVRRVVSTSFLRDTTRRVVVTFTRDCIGVRCEDGVDCIAGRCVGVDPGDAGVDAGVDASEPDGGTDAGVDEDASAPEDASMDAGEGDAGTILRCIDETCVGHIVISEVSPRASGTGGADEFIELYNRGDISVDVGGMRIVYISSMGSVGTRGTIDVGTVMPPRSYLLLGSAGYAGSVARDPVMPAWTTGIADTATIALEVGAAVRVDMLGYGGAPTAEGSAATSDLPATSTLSYERKANATSTRESMAAGGADALAGNGHDTNVNADDFVVRIARDPQSSTSPREP